MLLVMMMMIMGIITDTGAYQDDEGITDADHGDITDEHGEGATADADYDGNKNSTPDANY